MKITLEFIPDDNCLNSSIKIKDLNKDFDPEEFKIDFYRKLREIIPINDRETEEGVSRG